jgi:hypothetical protein
MDDGTAGCVQSDYAHCGPTCASCGKLQALSNGVVQPGGGCAYAKTTDQSTRWEGSRVLSMCSSETDVMNGRWGQRPAAGSFLLPCVAPRRAQ